MVMVMMVMFVLCLSRRNVRFCEKNLNDLLFLAAEACASDPLSEFCNDLQTAPDEVRTIFAVRTPFAIHNILNAIACPVRLLLAY